MSLMLDPLFAICGMTGDPGGDEVGGVDEADASAPDASIPLSTTAPDATLPSAPVEPASANVVVAGCKARNPRTRALGWTIGI
jgi:hypothetical protein